MYQEGLSLCCNQERFPWRTLTIHTRFFFCFVCLFNTTSFMFRFYVPWLKTKSWSTDFTETAFRWSPREEAGRIRSGANLEHSLFGVITEWDNNPPFLWGGSKRKCESLKRFIFHQRGNNTLCHHHHRCFTSPNTGINANVVPFIFSWIFINLQQHLDVLVYIWLLLRASVKIRDSMSIAVAVTLWRQTHGQKSFSPASHMHIRGVLVRPAQLPALFWQPSTTLQHQPWCVWNAFIACWQRTFFYRSWWLNVCHETSTEAGWLFAGRSIILSR